jgi:hypothetical protein
MYSQALILPRDIDPLHVLFEFYGSEDRSFKLISVLNRNMGMTKRTTGLKPALTGNQIKRTGDNNWVYKPKAPYTIRQDFDVSKLTALSPFAERVDGLDEDGMEVARGHGMAHI